MRPANINGGGVMSIRRDNAFYTLGYIKGVMTLGKSSAKKIKEISWILERCELADKAGVSIRVLDDAGVCDE